MGTNISGETATSIFGMDYMPKMKAVCSSKVPKNIVSHHRIL